MSSIYLTPLEEDEWATSAREHNEALNERWKRRLRVDTSFTPDAKTQPEAAGPKLSIDQGLGKPVVPVIMRANFLGTFDALLDGFETLEREYDVRIPLIHGGVGPVVPNDIVQAQIGNKFTFCPVYAFQVPIHNDAAKHAIINKIVVKSFNLYSDLLDEVKGRCKRTLERAARPAAK